MATTVRGTAIFKWGTYTLTTYVVNDSNIEVEGSEEMIDDESGQNVTHVTNFGLKSTGTLEVIPLSGATVPSVDAVITYNSLTYALVKISQKNNKRQPATWVLSLSRIPGLTYT